MKTEVHIDPDCREPRLILVTPELTEEQKRILEQVRQTETIPGYQGQQVTPIPVEEILRFYTENQRVLMETPSDAYTVRLRLYELEARLSGQNFIRISQGELINLAQVQKFDLSFMGTIRVELKNGKSAFVSRRYVKKLKTALGI